MVKMQGHIKKIHASKQHATLTFTAEWREGAIPVSESNAPICTLPLERKLVDKALSLTLELVEIIVEDGQITAIGEIPKEEPCESPEGFCLETLRNAGEPGISQQDLITRLQSKHDVSLKEAEELIRGWIRDGTIYRPRNGWLRLTDLP